MVKAPPRFDPPPQTKVVCLREGENRIGVALPRSMSSSGYFMIIFALIWNGGGWWAVIEELTDHGFNAHWGLIFIFPFVLIGLGVLIIALWLLFGRASLVMDRNNLLARRELLGLRFQRRYDVPTITDIRLTEAYKVDGRPVYGVGIHIEGKSMPFTIGSQLSEKEKDWLLGEVYDFWQSVSRGG